MNDNLSLSMPDVVKRDWGRWRACAVMLLTLYAVACSGSGDQGMPAPLQEDHQGTEPTPQVLRTLSEDPALIAPVPDVVHTQTMANTGLQIAYTTNESRALAPASVVEQQWVFMQECLQQVSAAPVVLVREGPAVPLTPADDVVRNENIMSLEINSVPIASASTLHGVVIQVSVSDFDGSLGTPAFNLRSIMGRHLWLAASLPERDYPFECARQQP